MAYYGVRHGRSIGVFDNWPEAEDSVHGFSNCSFKKFNTFEEAEDFVYGTDEHYHGAHYNEYEYDSDSESVGEVYVDGSCFGNGTPQAHAGIGVYWGQNSPFNVSERLKGRQTNIRAELTAARFAIEQATEQEFDLLYLYTDSKFFKDCYENRLPIWEENGWVLADGWSPVKNRSDWKRLREAMEESTAEVEIIFVPGHSGNEGNDEADYLAKLGAKMPYPHH